MLVLGWAQALANTPESDSPVSPAGLYVSEDGHSFSLPNNDGDLRTFSDEPIGRDNSRTARLSDREYVTTSNGAGLLVPPPHRDSPPTVSYLHDDQQTHLAWGSVDKAQSYAIEIDGRLADVTEDRTSTIPYVSDGSVTVTALSAPANQARNVISRIDENTYSETDYELAGQILAELVVWPSTPEELARVSAELRELDDSSASLRETDTRDAAIEGNDEFVTPESAETLSAPAVTRIRHTTFIPDASVTAFPCRTNGTFIGDNRGFSATAPSYRTRGDIVFSWPGNSFQRTVGTTFWRQSNGHVIPRTQSLAGMTSSFTSPNTTRRTFRINHDMGNPFCLSGTGRIFATYQGDVRRVSGFNALSLWGTHDRAPNHEVYYTDSQSGWFTVRRWNRGAFTCLTPSPCTRVSYSVTR